ncbi:ZIP Zinc transporter [Verticillium alfalfae VaMs.102]|uniref:ZIP Zinc transporter n=1 Tax=Verticillium alfalfae (strain VaMs.102 / ATCC MYA-4576 / FGSC 10136) TaxID=526221 RepID=C9S7R1_VERA1|nr:ZIP Zinc transporter [Verticillium alfalfae VaMs.102]EEY14796.1 ZIP Zinc transporter [Verticillium alfalfae VaMs.102]
MAIRSLKPVLCGLVLAFALHAGIAAASSAYDKGDPLFNAQVLENLSLEELDGELQQCPIVASLSGAKATHFSSQTSSFLSRAFAVLFPAERPAINALLATLYISGPPNLLLALCPPDIDPASLSVMVAFAVGGLLGDTLFHLLPEIFLGEDEPDKTRFVLGLRIATGGAGHDHGHGHSHGEAQEVAAEVVSSALDKADGKAKNRKAKKGEVAVVKPAEKEISASVKLGGYLNLIADFTHNITDGLAMSASFYASPTIGATTTVAVFFHEIPHEVGDFALLVQSGFSKRAAMGAQFVTALGALLGTLIGIAVQELGGGAGDEGGPMGRNGGIWGTSLSWGDLLLPFTAGTFLYVGTVAVIPELLETGPNKAQELKKTVVQFAAIALGAGIMLFISWHD